MSRIGEPDTSHWAPRYRRMYSAGYSAELVITLLSLRASIEDNNPMVNRGGKRLTYFYLFAMGASLDTKKAEQLKEAFGVFRFGKARCMARRALQLLLRLRGYTVQAFLELEEYAEIRTEVCDLPTSPMQFATQAVAFRLGYYAGLVGSEQLCKNYEQNPASNDARSPQCHWIAGYSAGSRERRLEAALRGVLSVNETTAGDDPSAWANAMLAAHRALGEVALDEN